jgi:hypothetical protein
VCRCASSQHWLYLGCQIVSLPLYSTSLSRPDDLTSRLHASTCGGGEGSVRRVPVPTSRVQNCPPWSRATPRSTPSSPHQAAGTCYHSACMCLDGAQISGRRGHMAGQGTVLRECKQDHDAGRQLRGLGRVPWGGKVRRQTRRTSPIVPSVRAVYPIANASTAPKPLPAFTCL